MAKVCTVCGKRAYSDYCVQHKPRKPIAHTTIKPKVAKKKPKAKTRSYYVKQLDSVFSKYIRYSAVESDGLVWCVTCQNKLGPKAIQNGHYYSRGHYGTRWDEMNCHPQCVGCNVFKKGNYTEYAIYMVDRYGIEEVKALKVKADTIYKISTPVLREMIEEYKAKLLTYYHKRDSIDT